MVMQLYFKLKASPQQDMIKLKCFPVDLRCWHALFCDTVPLGCRKYTYSESVILLYDLRTTGTIRLTNKLFKERLFRNLDIFVLSTTPKFTQLCRALMST